MISEPFSRNGIQIHQKSMDPVVFWHMGDRHVAKPYQTCRKWRVGRGRKLKIPEFALMMEVEE